jgi:hypothetical protein
VHFVGPLAYFDRRLAGGGRKHARHLRSRIVQVDKEAMFLKQAFGIAHGAVMALDEESAIFGTDDSRSGERARADGQNF